MVREPRLHLHPIIRISLLLRLSAGRRSILHHPTNRARDQRPEDKVAGRQHGAVGVPGADCRRLERLVALEPARGETAGDGRRGCDDRDEPSAGLEHGVPVSGERLACYGRLGIEEGEELGVLVEGEADGGGGGADWEQQPKMRRLRLERRHGGGLDSFAGLGVRCGGVVSTAIDVLEMKAVERRA